MTLGFLLLTVGASLIYTAFKDMPISDLALGRPAPAPKPGILDGLSGGGGGGSSSSTAAPLNIDRRTSGVGSWKGTPVAKWILPILKRAVSNGWDGGLSSGYRTPAQSEAICMGKCGAPSCASPNDCAGRDSNHSGKRFPAGAIDVSNPASFESAMSKMGHPLRNSLPSDRAHYSVSGR